MPRFEFDHVAVAVHAIKPALRLFKDALGGDFLMGGEEGDETWRWFQLKYPGGKMELLEPLKEGFLSKFLSERGEGLHHVTFKTDNIVEAIAHVESLGFELVDKHLDNPDWKEAFFRPTKSHGTLIQIAQSSQPDEVVSQFARPSNLDELLS